MRKMRILDLDVDFFVKGAAHWVDPDSEDRLDPERYPAWELGAALAFLTRQCLLSGKQPGFVVEHHSDLFYCWGEAIRRGVLPARLSVAHIDAHADLGMGDAAYAYLMNELAFHPIQERYEILVARRPASRTDLHELGSNQLGDGNWLAFALACGWMSELTYVFNGGEGRPGDLVHYLMKDFDLNSDQLQLCAVGEEDLKRDLMGVDSSLLILGRDPAIPFRTTGLRGFQAADPFDIVCLTRSPAYTPAASDAIFEGIRRRFIDESVLNI